LRSILLETPTPEGQEFDTISYHLYGFVSMTFKRQVPRKSLRGGYGRETYGLRTVITLTTFAAPSLAYRRVSSDSSFSIRRCRWFRSLRLAPVGRAVRHLPKGFI
jgi:hypothetical protein